MVYRRLFGFPNPKHPFGEPERMKKEMARFFKTVPPSPGAGMFPLVNLTEDKDSYYVRAELPGIDTGDLDIQATVNSLSLSGKRKIPAEGENVKYHRKERESGKFSRIIHLPDAVEPEKVEARLVNGILTVGIPKSDTSKPRKIRVC